MIYEHTSYRSYLKEVLADRTRKNPKYSLRAMAKQIGFASSSLSEVMSGTTNFSLKSARKLAAKLALASDETEYLCLLVQLESTREPEIRESLLERLTSLRPKKIPMHDLSVDQFKQVSEWYYSPILEMIHLNNFEITPTSVSKKLGISKIEAEVAIERLIRLEFLEINKKDKLQAVHGRLFNSIKCSNKFSHEKLF